MRTLAVTMATITTITFTLFTYALATQSAQVADPLARIHDAHHP